MLSYNPVSFLRFRVLDHDTYSAHDAIGKVYIDLNPLLISTKDSPEVISGWFPIYDTMHGMKILYSAQVNPCSNDLW